MSDTITSVVFTSIMDHVASIGSEVMMCQGYRCKSTLYIQGLSGL